MEALVIGLALIIFYLAVRRYDYYLKTRLFEHVSWCVGGNSLEDLRYSPLLDIICNAQRELNLSKEYCLIEESERTTAKEILKYFQEYLTQAYFKGNLSSHKNSVKMKSETYFILSLRRFLEKHQCESYFHEKELYDFLSTETLGTVFGKQKVRTYRLTAYGRVYYKLLYTVRHCCIDIFRNKLKDDTEADRSTEAAEGSKEVLDTNIFKTYQYL